MVLKRPLETVDCAEIQPGVVTLNMNSESGSIPRTFLLKQIENEINAGFVFVEAARKALKRSQPEEAGAVLEKAARMHEHIVEEVAHSPAAQIRAVNHQLTELRAAIDWLHETIKPEQR